MQWLHWVVVAATMDPAKLITKGRVNLDKEGRQFELRCATEYWAKVDKKDGNTAPTGTVRMFEQTAVHPAEGMKDFMSEVDRLEEEYDIVFISDNPVFDFSWINYYLDVYLHRTPLAYKKDRKSYRSLKDLKEAALDWVLISAEGEEEEDGEADSDPKKKEEAGKQSAIEYSKVQNRRQKSRQRIARPSAGE